MVTRNYIKETPSGCRLSVEVHPGAKVSEIAGVNEWRGELEVKIAAEPVEGAANEKLVKLIAQKLGVPARSISIVRGERSHHKILDIPLKPDAVRKLLGGT